MAPTIDELLAAAEAAGGPSAVDAGRIAPGGVDPLGLRQINFQLMDTVLPGLNNVARRLRPFVLMAWAWRRVEQIVERDGRGGDTDERMRDFVDRVEAIWAWSQFLVDPEPGIPGGLALQALVEAEGYRFGGADWVARRDLRRSSTGLISPLNYGPGLRSMGWLLPVGPIGVFRADPALDPALDAFEAIMAGELDHPAFSALGDVTVTQVDVRRWGALWAIGEATEAEKLAGRLRIAGDSAVAERRSGLALVRAAAETSTEGDDPASVRTRMCAPATEWNGGDAIAATAATWRRVQVRQLFRLALEGMLHWMVQALDDGPLDSRELAERFLAGAPALAVAPDAAAWLAAPVAADGPVTRLRATAEALATGDALPAAIATALAYCLSEAPATPEPFEAADRLPIARAAAEAASWGVLPPLQFMVKVIDVWVLAQHAYWSIGRGLADARGRGKSLLRLKVVMDEGGWTLTPGTRPGAPPVATPDRLESALGLLRECGTLPS